MPSNRAIQAARVAERTAPWLWALAYARGGGRPWWRRLALRLWVIAFRVRLRREGL